MEGLLNLLSKSEPPKITIGPGVTVNGVMNFERPVKLYVSDTAKIGEVVGAEVVRFSGMKPE